MTPWHLRQAARALRHGGIIAYPTEAVYGLGCDPLNATAVLRLLALKKRPVEKGLILIANDFQQLAPFVRAPDPDMMRRISATWPGPITWLLPAKVETPAWLRGAHDTLAVRVTAHPQAAALCRAFGGALVSTSANPAGRPPARQPLRVRHYFNHYSSHYSKRPLDYILHGAVYSHTKPTEIRDALTGKVIRPA